jgi:hypothetical protein
MALTKVTNTGIADDAVTTDKIEDGTVVAADIAPGTIANAKLANSSITLNGSSVSLGGSATVKHIDWQALTVADGSTTLNTTAGKGYFLDTNAGVIEVFLPSSPTRGDTVVLADYSGTFATNQIIINTGGQLLDSTAGNDFKVTTNNSIVELVYVDAAKGWLVKLNQAAGTTPSSALDEGNVYDSYIKYIAATGGTVTTSGDYKIHTFTGDGCFVVSCGGNPVGSDIVDYLVVAGGGAGGASPQWNGGGGAGGFRVSNGYSLPAPTTSPLANPTGVTVTATTYPITVGGGGSPVSPSNQGNPGSNSIFSTITSTGGGGGGATSSGPITSGLPGGSGGGAGEGSPSPSYPGGSGNTPPVSPPQGNPGGLGGGNSGSGGGGASQTGQGGGGPGVPGGAGPLNGGFGGAGSYISPSFAVGCAGTTGPVCGVRYFAGGGGGGANGSAGQGGSGGGGTGADYPSTNATAGSTNTGGGGGGSAYQTGTQSSGGGGSGIVILRYKFQN